MEDDTVQTGVGQSLIPGLQARSRNFVKEEPAGTSYAYALLSWDGGRTSMANTRPSWPVGIWKSIRS